MVIEYQRRLPNENRVVITPAGVEAYWLCGTRYSLKTAGWAAALLNIPGAVPRLPPCATNATMYMGSR